MSKVKLGLTKIQGLLELERFSLHLRNDTNFEAEGQLRPTNRRAFEFVVAYNCSVKVMINVHTVKSMLFKIFNYAYLFYPDSYSLPIFI
jgi:hypothetical protein